MRYFLLIPALVLLSAGGHAAPEKQVFFKNTEGETVGAAQLAETEKGVLLTFEFHNLPPGERAIHIHEKADCTPADGDKAFTNTGGHYNPEGYSHGYRDEEGHHAGDLPNLFVGEDGHVKVEVLNDRVTLADAEGRAPLFDADGSALIVHAGPDDYESQPTGDAGGRIACAEIK